MGLLSSRGSVVCYRVKGKLPEPVNMAVYEGLKRNIIRNIDNDPADCAVGWTSFETPFSPMFTESSFLFGEYWVFSLRIDKKSIPAKVVAKCCAQEVKKRLEKSGEKTLAKNEKKRIREKVLHDPAMRVPATPNVYDLAWQYETGQLLFFSTQKGANQELETIFFKSFSLPLVRLFPYTLADLECDLSDRERDRLFKLSPTRFTG